MSWSDRAQCRAEQVPLEVFFTDSLIAEALAVCARCPVQTECLKETWDAEKGQVNGDLSGVFGNTTAAERVRMRKALRRQRKSARASVVGCQDRQEGIA